MATVSSEKTDNGRPTSSYWPSHCGPCRSNKLTLAATPLSDAFLDHFVGSRDSLISAINDGQMTDEQLAKLDYRMPGYTEDMWEAAGIKSMCCKRAILAHIPYDVFVRAYSDANETKPADFDVASVTWETVQTMGTKLPRPIKVPVIGTKPQYDS